MTQFKYISSISSNELETNVVIPCIDEDGYSCILIKNSKNKVVVGGYSTDNLEVKLNRTLFRDENEYFFHIIKGKKTDSYSRGQFDTIFDYVFSKIEDPIDDIELSSLITSLEDYFKTTPEKNKRDIQIGVFGELFCIYYLYESEMTNIVDKYHTNFYSKHDVELTDRIRLEIKTTTSEKRIHHFKHNQICRTDVNVLVASIMLEESKEGTSLFEMFLKVQRIFTNPDSLFALKKLMIRCGVDNANQGLSFSFAKAENDIRFYEAKKLPKIPQTSFDGVTNIEYDVDCSTAEHISIDEISTIVNNYSIDY